MSLIKCPRCNEKTYELLKTHSYCLCCNYSPDLIDYRRKSADDLPIPPWAAEAVMEVKIEIEKHFAQEKNKKNQTKKAA